MKKFVTKKHFFVTSSSFSLQNKNVWFLTEIQLIIQSSVKGTAQHSKNEELLSLHLTTEKHLKILKMEYGNHSISVMT
jgi:hypothetical protein